MTVYYFLDEIRDHFVQFGTLTVDWPHKAQSKAYFPPKGIQIIVYTLFILSEGSHNSIYHCF